MNPVPLGRALYESWRSAAAVFLVVFGILGIRESSAALGDPTPINSVQCISITSLNFSASGVRQQIGLFLINSNTSNGFHITFSFENLGNFKAGTRSIAITALVLNKISGTFGSATDPANEVITLDGSGDWIWRPFFTTPPIAETENYLVEIDASWTAPVGGIAGFYMEKINAVIVSGP
jgi:hypothetical protein